MTASHGLSQRLELRASQSLVMTQQLQQSIKLLQMTALEVEGFITQQLEDNPFLSESETASEEGESATISLDAAPADDAPEGETFLPEEWRESSDFRDGSELRLATTPRDRDGNALEAEDTRAKEITLREHVLAQFLPMVEDETLRRIGIHVIDLIDEAGYIRDDLSAMAAQLGTEPQHIEAVLSVVQSCDPVGVGAQSIEECLALQLKERDRLDPAMHAMLQHLPLLASGNLEALRKACGVEMDDLKDMVAELRALNPKPGLAFHHEVVQHAVPDVSVRRDATGHWHVELNQAALPRVLVNRRYYAQIAEGSAGEDRKYMTEKMNEANWLVKALDQRAHTILKTATAIVAAQENFFRMGIHHLKPLTLKDIARDTGFHESTISRVTTGKYMVTPRGVYEFKYFFTSGVGHSAGGEDVSSQTVKHLIKELIDGETQGAVLSDDDLAEKLKTESIHVARRTVAKYREALGIPSSTQRRRLKVLAG